MDRITIGRGALLLGLTLSLVYPAAVANRGWIPHDEGALGQAAERVMLGELPHRDFDALYTGGLEVMHAATFRVLGVSIRSMRTQLLFVFFASVPAFLYVVMRLTSASVAVAALLLAAVWTVPMYPASMPSWYNLLFAIWAVAALNRWIETGTTRWLVLSGVVAGLSITVKISGLFLLVGITLFLVFVEQEWSSGRWRPRWSSTVHPQRPNPKDAVRGVRPNGFEVVTWLSILAWATSVWKLVGLRMGWLGVGSLMLPSIMLAGWLIGPTWLPSTSSRDRFRALAGLMTPVAFGCAIPLLLLVLPYVVSGSVYDLVRGLVLLPSRRFQNAEMVMAPLWTAAPILIGAGGIWLFARLDGVARAFIFAVLVNLVGLWVYICVFQVSNGVSILTLGLPALVPILVYSGLRRLGTVRRGTTRYGSSRPIRLFLLLAVTACCSLIQVPYGYFLYFFYVGALVAAAAAAVFFEARLARSPATLVVGVGVLVVSVLGLNGRFDYHTNRQRLALPRAGIDVDEVDRATYEELVSVMTATSRSEFVYATPDSPEVYFLSGRKNPTRTLFDFFDEPDGRTLRIIRALDAHDVDLSVVNRSSDFSGPPPQALLDSLEARYPHSREIGQFLVLSKNPVRDTGSP